MSPSFSSAGAIASANLPSAHPAPTFSRFQLLHWPLTIMDAAARRHSFAELFGRRAAATRYPFRALRYWWAVAALTELGRTSASPLCVLDAGCQGGFLKRFADPVLRARWTALDCHTDHPLLAAADYHRVVRADLEQPLPFPDESQDAIVSLHVFEHLRTPEQTLREYARVVRRGGLILLGFPTMPGWLAPLREAQHRRGMARGVRPDWGHQQVFHPARCRAMAKEAGLHVELLAGSHFFRCTGAAVENSSAWVRLNQVWGALLPALGSELCVVLRRPE